jgi:titin
LLLHDADVTTYTQPGLTEGTSYRFKIRAVNIYGAGPDSAEVTIVASDIPSKMDPVSTARSGTDIVSSFTTPAHNGADIDKYEIVIYDKGTSQYVEDTAQCDGNSADVKQNLECTWAISYLQNTYSYLIGDLVLFKARAHNADDWGAQSNPNLGGATIMTVPVAGPTPTEDPSTSYQQMVVNWAALTSLTDIGGTSITSYALEWDNGSAGSYVVLKGDPTLNTDLTHTVSTHTNGTAITPGHAYVFRVRARNEVGWGVTGPTLTIYPSSVPAQMATVVTSHTSVYAKIEWEAPDNRGAPIDNYRILIRQNNGTMTETSTYCDGTDP